MINKLGLHLYVNIDNFEKIIEKEESEGGLKHSIHALDTFFTSIEKFILTINKGIGIKIEKITGSRLHIHIDDESSLMIKALLGICYFTYELSLKINKEISKYNSLLPFEISVGASYGKYCEFIFDENLNSEETTIGHACNFAAKIQSLTLSKTLAIDEDIYQMMPNSVKQMFKEIEDSRITKYGESRYFTIGLFKIEEIMPAEISAIDIELNKAIKYANDLNLSDMKRIEIRSKLTFDVFNRTNYASLNCVPLFADIRGSTAMFDSDDKNLNVVSEKVKNTLIEMYRNVVDRKGIHVQFQGDREFALFNDYDKEKSCENAVLAAMKIIENNNILDIRIGIGLSYGRVYATKIGARGNKDNIVLGKVINETDDLEDSYAGKNEIAISEEVYKQLCKANESLSKIFKKKSNVYITDIGFESYQNKLLLENLRNDNSYENYNGVHFYDERK